MINRVSFRSNSFGNTDASSAFSLSLTGRKARSRPATMTRTFIFLTILSGLGEAVFRPESQMLAPGQSVNDLQYPNEVPVRKTKIEELAEIFGPQIERINAAAEVELVILVDASGSIGAVDFQSEMRFIQKLVSDMNLNRNAVRLAVLTFASNVTVHVNHLESDPEEYEKCFLLHYVLPNVPYYAHYTNTLAAVLEAENILLSARPNALKVVFLVSDGESNQGSPIGAAENLKRNHTEIFTFGIEKGNVDELRTMASEPVEEHCYVFGNFSDFEGFERRALHRDLKPGTFVPVGNSSLCNLICETPGEDGCCKDGAKCNCGLLSGYFTCLCPPGYYGKGMGEEGCKPCPSGTYSDGTVPGDSFVCTPCPDRHQTTKKHPATGIEDCVCGEGYIPEGNMCKETACPELKPPNNGYFVRGKCSKVINAACGIRCHMGFTLSGSSVRICQKNATWSGVAPTCVPKRCEGLPPVANSDLICVNEEDGFETVIQYNSTGDSVKHFVKWLDPKNKNQTSKTPKLLEYDMASSKNKTIELNYKVDTECRISCSPGYYLVGSKSRNCLPMLRWSGLKNSCKAIKCRSLQKIESGTVSPDNCTADGVKHHFAETCHYSCNAGYELKGPKVANCTGKHGSWSVRNNPSRCIDVEAPKFPCPLNMTVPTDPGVHFATLNLSLPNATDNSGKEPVVWSKPPLGKDYPLKLVIGASKIEIYSVDDTGNRAFCSFNVIVEDRENPQILECESPPPFFISEFAPNSTEIKWKEPVVDDNSGVPIPLTRSPSTSSFPLGTTSVVYTAKDRAGNSASCTINITLLENPCNERPELTNTLWKCTAESDVVRCNVSCSHGYAFSSLPKSRSLALSCTFSGGRATWSPDLFGGDMDMFPECSEIVTPNEIKGEIFASIDFDMCTELDKLSNEISKKMSAAFGEENVPVFSDCEDDIMAFRKEKEEEEEKLEEETNVIRKKRETKRRKLRIDFTIKGGRKTDEEEILKNLSETRTVIKDFYGKRGNATDLTEPVLETKLKPRCKSGSLLTGNICVKCPKGTFHNETNSSCDPCPIGEYQEVEGQLNCTPCPEGYSTRKIRRRHPKHCKKICPPGSFGRKISKAGLALSPCVPCPAGTYQPSPGVTSCESCPEGYITPRRGSTESGDCVLKAEYEDLCFGFICMNGGSCFVSDGFPLCKCPPGFLGSFCQRVFDPCGSSPCFNGGKCVPTGPVEYECKCPDKFEGNYCEREVSVCSSNPCGSQGECIEFFDGYFCNCFEGFKGETCSERISQCQELEPCLNSGTCLDVDGSYKCSCPEEYTGSLCEEPVDCRLGNAENCEEEVIPQDTPCWNVLCGENQVCAEQWNRQPLCVCAPGFRGVNCSQVIQQNVILHFPKYGVTEYLSADFPPAFLNAISICVWIETEDKFNYGTIFSYATRDDDNAFTLTDYSGMVLYVSGDHVVTDLVANDGQWHFICISWEAWNGDWRVYLDGDIHTSGSGLAKNSFIPGNGRLVVGQEQDYFGGGFNELESFSGRMYSFDVWNRVLPDWEVKKYFESCMEVRGDWISWTQLLQNIHGNIQEKEFVFCKACPENLTLPDGQITYQNAVEHMTATYRCNEGFRLQFDKPPLEEKKFDSWDRRCRKYGNWEWEKPVCSRVSCGSPEEFLRGNISESTYLFGDIIRYNCSEEYELKGNDTRVCQANGVWSGEAPVCLGNSSECTKLVAPRHGSMFVYFSEGKTYEESEPKPGDKVEFTCDKGFILNGSSNLTCLGDIWDKKPPECERIKCQFPQEASSLISKTIPRTANFFFEDSLTLHCPNGAKDVITCGESGTWNISFKACGGRCPEKPRSPANGYVVLDGRNDSFYEGENFPVRCMPGFLIFGDKSVKCSKRSTWTQFMRTFCQRLMCGPLPPAPHPYIIVKQEGHSFGDRVYLGCAPGFRKTGNIVIRCEANRKWSRIRNSCVKDGN